MPKTRTLGKSKSEELLQALSYFDRILLVTHDNPDPDAIAAGWALHTLIQQKLAKPVDVLGGGAIVRAENRHMVDLLFPPIELVDELVVVDGVAVVLVDCGIGMTNHLVTRRGIHPAAVIDHHLNGKRSPDVPFVDSRPDVAASTSIAAGYLREQGIEPGVKLATAMLYAIRTETRGFETHHSDDLVVSMRTERPKDNAAELVQEVLAGLGSAGGHGHRAGGKISAVAGQAMTETLSANLRRRWLTACGISHESGAPLISRTEILGQVLRREDNQPGIDPG